MVDADDIMFMDSQGTNSADDSFNDQDSLCQNKVSIILSYHFVTVGLAKLGRPYLGLRSHL